jgi:NAD(P)-dependent dehydrogenase (short-subunit alcohol dehydrogenase family)
MLVGPTYSYSKIALETDSLAGVGKELCKILYQHNGTVYVAGRSQSKADSAIEEIKQAHPNSDGRLEFLHVDLADLPTIKKSVEEFQKREQRLDVLTNSRSTLQRSKRRWSPSCWSDGGDYPRFLKSNIRIY